jgi:hypothetical protein
MARQPGWLCKGAFLTPGPLRALFRPPVNSSGAGRFRQTTLPSRLGLVAPVALTLRKALFGISGREDRHGQGVVASVCLHGCLPLSPPGAASLRPAATQLATTLGTWTPNPLPTKRAFVTVKPAYAAPTGYCQDRFANSRPRGQPARDLCPCDRCDGANNPVPPPAIALDRTARQCYRQREEPSSRTFNPEPDSRALQEANPCATYLHFLPRD